MTVRIRLFSLRATGRLSTLGLASLLVAAIGCQNQEIQRLASGGKKASKTQDEADDEDQATGTAGGGGTPAAGAALGEADALAMIGGLCAPCHAPGASLHSTWPMPAPDKLTVESLAAMDTAATAYQTLVHKFAKAPSTVKPAPMPTSDLPPGDQARLEGLILWWRLAMPSVVEEAEGVYGETAGLKRDFTVDLNYACKQRASTRNYVARLFNQALGRPPRPEEMTELAPAGELEQPVSDERRRQLAAYVTEGGGRDDFYAYGLRMFAQRVGGAGAIEAAPALGLTPAIAADLREEFHQLLRRYAGELPYRDILLAPKVFVSGNTYALYNTAEAPCANPGAGKWAECQLSDKRANYFGTVGFLRSAPSSFLVSNNNYKRGGEMHSVIKGEGLNAQTDGPKGADAAPVPACLSTADTRVVLAAAGDSGAAVENAAPRGAAAVPRQGSICQSCHLHQYLAVASYVFRPFDEAGRIIAAPQLATAGGPYADAVKAATEPTNVARAYPGTETAPVDVRWLQSLLAETDGATGQCIQDRRGNVVKDVKGIRDLGEFMLGDGRSLVRGLARFIPRAIGNQPITNQEIMAAVSRAYDAGGGRLLPVFKAYFETESFACAVEQQ